MNCMCNNVNITHIYASYLTSVTHQRRFLGKPQKKNIYFHEYFHQPTHYAAATPTKYFSGLKNPINDINNTSEILRENNIERNDK